MTWPRPWRQRLDGRLPAPQDHGDDREEVRLHAVTIAGRHGDPRKAARAAALYGLPSFRHCRACDVQWHGGPACWCCGNDVT